VTETLHTYASTSGASWLTGKPGHAHHTLDFHKGTDEGEPDLLPASIRWTDTSPLQPLSQVS